MNYHVARQPSAVSRQPSAVSRQLPFGLSLSKPRPPQSAWAHAMHKLAALLLPLIFLAAPAQAAIVPGAIPGNFGISESGAATYSIPIAIPPGTAGMEPKFSLNYSSQSGNGIAGVGWSLGGLSAITRCTVDRAPNTSVRVSFTAADRFCLDGQRLVALSGTYGASGTEYRTERETFSKIVSSGTAGTGPASFKVWTKAGLIMEYGVTSDARILAESKAEARVWALNKISDTNGNYFAVSYTQDAPNADYVPVRIDYTGNTTAAVVPYNKVELVYEFRPDPSTGYAAGVRVGQTQRLTHVLAYTGTTLVSDYTLAYDAAPVTQRSRLASLTRCAGDGNCLAPTQFTWLDGELASYAPDTETLTPAGSVDDTHFALGDMNADGRTDGLLLKVNVGSITGSFFPYLSQTDGSLAVGLQQAVYGTAGTQISPSTSKLLLQDFLSGNGTADPVLIAPLFNSRWPTGLDGAIGAKQGMGGYLLTDTMNLWFVRPSELNGNGVAEHVVYVPEGGSGTPALKSNGIFDIQVFPPTAPTQSFFEVVDINGDNLSDALRYDPSNGLLHVWLSNGTGLSAMPLIQTLIPGGSPLNRWFQLADINGDGLGDLVLHIPSSGLVRTWIAKGDGTFVNGTLSGLSPGGLPADTWFQMVDINADGRADAVKYSPASGNLTYALSLGDGGFDTPATVYLGSGPLPTPHIGSAPYTQWFSPADINGDGVLDWVRYAPESGRIKVSLGQGGVPDQLAAITDGHGAETRLTYKPLTDAGVYTKGTGAVYPEQDVQNAMQVVANVEIDNGIGGLARTSYAYAGLKAKVDGGGLLGFKTMTVRDEQTGIRTTTEYRQDSPYTGQVAKVTRTTSNGTVIGQTTNTWAAMYPGNVTVYLYVSESVVDSFDTGNGALIGRTKDFQYGLDAYGNVPIAIRMTFAADDLQFPAAAERTQSTFTNDVSNWRLGRTTRIYRDQLRPEYVSAYGWLWVPDTNLQLYQRRGSAFEYDPVTGLLTKEIIEPDAANVQMRLDTTYTHDAFGNRKTATVSSPATGTAAIVSRTTTTTYDTKGQLPVTTANALGHSETKTFDPRFGTVATLTGPNALTTIWLYDGFGRKTLEVRADGTTTAWSYLACDAACPGTGVYRVVTQIYAPGNIQTAPVSIAYFDRLNREVRAATQGFDGRWIYKDIQYDNRGNIAQISRPRFAGEPAYWIVSQYDELNRLVQVIEPDNLTTPALVVTYNGLTVSRTNRKGQIASETRNVLGQKVSVTDALGQATSYTYDVWGNLATVAAPGGIITSNLYDLRGRKTQTTDPDLGLWKYEYNALGELVKQTDAKNQAATLVYDKLGRMTQRIEPGMTGEWIYDTAPRGTALWLGKLRQSRVVNGATVLSSITHSYDGFGRVYSTNQASSGDTTLNVFYTRDAAGRLSRQTFHNGIVALINTYNARGYHTETRKFVSGAVGELYWRADAMDAEGHLTRETTGNGIVTERSHDPVNGRLQNIIGNLGATQIQAHAYVYDTLGNVTIVADAPGNQLEIRGGYDALNRLTNTDITVNGVTTSQNLTYDALGNILSKTGIGGYTYGDPLHKHAVTNAGSNSYSYDANGNLIGGAGRSVSWTSWNMPAALTQAGQTQSWTYNADHERIKLVTPGRTTRYLTPSVHQGVHYERAQYTSGTIEYRVTLYGGGKPIGEIITASNGTTASLPPQARYFHSDAQGSITAVTNSAGAVITRYRYDPWGKQTVVSGSNTGIEQTRQGHTGHEMLDGGLTHMNGRLYDPQLTRFVSADPYVDNPFDLQSLNRYSYVNNNPFGFTDPTGFSKWTKFRDKWLKPIVAIVASVFIGPAVYGAVFNAALAASGTASMAGSLWAASIAGGMASGAVVGGVTGGIYNGPQGIAQGAKYGAIGGAVMGPVSAMYSGAYNGSLNGAARYGYSAERVAVQSLAGGVSSAAQGRSFADGLKSSLIPSALAYMAASMRAGMWDQSQLDPRNSSGVSGGLMGDGNKIGGGRYSELNPDGISPLGGKQGGRGFLGIMWNNEPLVGGYYAANSWQDRLVEAYSGPHDWLNSGYWYNAAGNAIGHQGVASGFGEILNGLNVIPASVFAGASVVQPYNYSAVFGR